MNSRDALGITLVAAALCAGCQSASDTYDSKDAPMSVEDARALAATFEYVSLSPPPRTIADVRKMLGRPTPVPSSCAAKRRERRAEAEEAEALLSEFDSLYDGTGASLGFGLGLRIIHSAERSFDLGDYQQAIEDLKVSVDNVPRMIKYRRVGGRKFFISADGQRALIELMMHATLARIHAAAGDAVGADTEKDEVVRRYDRASKSQNFKTNARTYRLMAEGSAAQSAGELLLAEARFRELLATTDWISVRVTAAAGFSTGARIDLAWAGARLSANLIQQGRLLEAELAARQTLKDAWNAYRYSPLMAKVGQPATQLAAVLLEQERLDEAEYVARMAVNFYEADCADPRALPLALARRTLIQIRVSQADWRGALDVIETAEQELAGDPGAFERIYGNDPEVGLALVETGRGAEGRERLRELLAGTEQDFGADSLEAAEVRGFLAIAEHRAGNLPEALESFVNSAPALASSQRNGAAVGRPGSTARARRVLVSYSELLGELSAGRTGASADFDTVNEHFKLIQELQLGRAQQAYGAATARAAARTPELAELVRHQQDAAQQMASILEILNYTAMSSAHQLGPDIQERLKARLLEIRQAEEVLRVEIDKRFPTYRNLLRPAPLNVAELQKHLTDDDALIAFQVGDEKTYVWAIPNSGRASFAAVNSGRSDLGAKVHRLRAAVDPGPIANLGEIPPFDLQLSHELYRTLLMPVSAGWIAKKHILIVPDGPLGQMPLSVLTTTPHPQTSSQQLLFGEYRNAPWLTRTHAFTVLPAVVALPSFGARAVRAAPSRAFAGFGDPWFRPAQQSASTETTMRGGTVAWRNAPKTRQADSADLALLPPLPETAGELQTIAQALGADPRSDVFLGKEATEANVKALNLKDRRVIAFATHGLLPGDVDGLNQPALAMTVPDLVSAGQADDGLLTVDEILTLEMEAEWVVLSACNTGTADGRGAEAISGLGRAFFYAGARALLVSNWPVHSQATMELTTTVFRNQASDPALTRSRALQTSMLALIDHKVYRDSDGRVLFSYAHPIFWAPFTLVGDGG